MTPDTKREWRSYNMNPFTNHVAAGEPFDPVQYAFRIGQAEYRSRKAAALECLRGKRNPELARKVVTGWGKRIKADSLPDDVIHVNGQGLRGVETEALRIYLRRANGHVPTAARLSGMSRSRLYTLVRSGVLLLLLLPMLAFAQQKGATLLMNLVNAPATPANVSVLAMPAAQIAAPPAYAYQAKVTVAWTPSPDAVTGYNVYWGTNTNQMTNIVTTTRTNLTFNVPEGVTVYVKARAYDANLIESPDSNMILTFTGFYGDVSIAAWNYRTKGRAGATNRVQVANSIGTTNWTTIATFVGNGTLRTFARTNVAQEFFRTVSP